MLRAQAAGQAELDLVGRVICCLDSDPLGVTQHVDLLPPVFGGTRSRAKMNRLYSVESRYSVTGATADSRLPLRSSQIGALLVALEQAVDRLLDGQAPPAPPADERPLDEVPLTEQLDRFVAAMADDLVKHQGAGVIYVGGHQPLEVQLLALRLNRRLGNLGQCVKLIPDRSVIEGVSPVSWLS